MFPFSAKFSDSHYAMVVGLKSEEQHHRIPESVRFIYPEEKEPTYNTWHSPYASTTRYLPLKTVFDEVVRSKKAGEIFVDFSHEAVKRLTQKSQTPPAP